MRRKRRGCRFSTILLLLIIAAVVFLYINKDAVIDYFFPRDYEEIIDTYCEQYDVDKWLVMALIREESGFETDAVSSVGAYGLMQLMPETAQWLVARGGFDFDAQGALTDPEGNICLGVYYLSILSAMYDDQYPLVIAAYNAGMGSVDRWMTEGIWDGSLENADNIPYDETRRHVADVLRSQKIYTRLYSE